MGRKIVIELSDIEARNLEELLALFKRYRSGDDAVNALTVEDVAAKAAALAISWTDEDIAPEGRHRNIDRLAFDAILQRCLEQKKRDANKA